MINKKISILLLASFALVGCNGNQEITSVISGTSEGSQITSTSATDSSVSETTSTSEETSSSSEIVEQETVTITFKNSSLTTGLIADHLDDFKTFFNAQANMALLTSVSSAASQNMAINQESLETGLKSALTIGTGSAGGYLQLSFSKTITKIEMNVQAYSKYDSYNKIWRNDSNAELYVNDETNYIDLHNTGTDKPTTAKDVSFDIQNKTTIKLYNNEANCRSFIHTMKLTYNK